ncbi:MAG TPA: 6-phosphogluconolactonase [Wenzhouxiangellaceae bacterium]|nr:6-phosphogluconolactonase [Wenzhouxiangellaceae bacterium]
MQMIEHPDFDSLSTTVARTLARTCAEAIETRHTATLALAGGSTPIPVYRRLADIELDWSRIVLLPGDDRWVAHDHPACNLRAMREAFSGVETNFRALTPAQPEGAPDTAAAQATLAELDGPFDACVLGMGTDGHFASLFPDSDGLTEALDPACKAQAVVVHPSPMPPDAPFARISLTLSRIAESRRLLLLIRGEDKRKVLQEARSSADPQRHPIAALLQHAGNALEIHWSP